MKDGEIITLRMEIIISQYLKQKWNGNNKFEKDRIIELK